MGHHHLLPYVHSHAHHHDDHHHNPSADVPKGCLAVCAGKEGGEEELQRFVVPVEYLNHPLFSDLLKMTEDEYGFDQKGTFTLPCRVAEFKSVKALIHQDIHDQHHHHHQRQQQHLRSHSGESSAGGLHHLRLAGCFKA